MPGCQLTMAMNTAAATTTTRTTIEAMCTLTIDCRCDTWSEGITRYQCPRIIAVHAPPRSAAELRKLATIIACAGKPDGEQNGGESGVEAEELHARFARDDDQREDDADAEMGEEEEQDHRAG